MTRINKTNRKLSAEMAAELIKKQVSAITDARIHARSESDDGGKHIVLYIEQPAPDSPLDPLVKETRAALEAHNWRLVVIKVPIGSIKVITDSL